MRCKFKDVPRHESNAQTPSLSWDDGTNSVEFSPVCSSGALLIFSFLTSNTIIELDQQNFRGNYGSVNLQLWVCTAAEPY